MAKLTKDDVLHVAKLAKLELTDEEIEIYVKQLGNIINYISELSEVDTSNVEPTSQTAGLTNIFRNDEIKIEGSLTQEQATSGTDTAYNGYFKVKAILSERSDK